MRIPLWAVNAILAGFVLWVAFVFTIPAMMSARPSSAPALPPPSPSAVTTAARPVESRPTPPAVPTSSAPAVTEPAPVATTGETEEAYYASCAAAKRAGAAPLHRGEPGYRKALDRDGDGTACE